MRLSLHCTVSIIRQFTLLSSEDYKIAWPPVVIDLDLDEHYISLYIYYIQVRVQQGNVQRCKNLPRAAKAPDTAKCSALRWIESSYKSQTGRSGGQFNSQRIGAVVESLLDPTTMNPMKVLSLVALLAVAAMGSPTSRDSSVNQALKPSQWLSAQELEALPAVDDLTLERLEQMSLEKGAELVQQVCKYRSALSIG